tara:strand:+ start:4313 stop:5482 length:1170 start_codon:yes stop_codon:yes gene_type:complete
MARNRVIYQSEALFTSKDYDSSSLSDHTQLHRVQSANYGFTINRQDVNQFGNLARIDSIVLEAPTVNFDLTYYPTNGYNERALDFYVQNENNTASGQFASGHLAAGSGQNLFILTVPEGKDANLNKDTGETENTVVGIGNAFLTDYTLDLSVGSLPTASISFEASNIISDTTISGDNVTISGFSGITSPAVNPEIGEPLGSLVTIPFATGNSHSGDYVAGGADQLAALRPGDIKIDLQNFDGTLLSDLSANDGIHVQSASLSIPLSRTPIERLGSKFPFARVVDFPVNATLNINAIVNTMDANNLAEMISGCGQEERQNVTLTLMECGGTQTGMKIELKGCTIDSESFSSSIGSNKSVDITFSTQIGGTRDTANGIFISGSNNTKLPWE